MWLRVVGTILVVSGTTGAAYLEWARHRLSGEVLTKDRQLPRPWPYPDNWLWRWEQRINIANPAPPGTLKFEGEIETVRERLANWVNLSMVAIALGLVPWLLWFHRQWIDHRVSQDVADYGEGRAIPRDRYLPPD